MRDFEGSWVIVDVGGLEVHTTICEHNRPAIECYECDLAGGNYRISDITSWQWRVRNLREWMKIKRDIRRITKRR